MWNTFMFCPSAVLELYYLTVLTYFWSLFSTQLDYRREKSLSGINDTYHKDFLALTSWQVQKCICCKIMNLSDPCWLLKEWHSIGSPIYETQFRCKMSLSSLDFFSGKRIILQKATGLLKWYYSLWFGMIHLIAKKRIKGQTWTLAGARHS